MVCPREAELVTADTIRSRHGRMCPMNRAASSRVAAQPALWLITRASLTLLRFPHGLRQRTLRERYHAQISELTATSIWTTQALTAPKYSIANTVNITRASSKLPPQLVP